MWTSAVADFNGRLLKMRPSERHVLLFVHGYNTRFEEAVYRFAQIAHDAGAPVVPVLFTWPSRGKLFDYVYDRESATYSRDALEFVLQKMVKNPNVTQISILAHSMGNFVTVEALRQMAIRNRGMSPKIKDIMLASPDIDFDVFRRQIAEIEASDKSPPVTLFVSKDDKALAASSLIAGTAPRLGEIDPHAEPYKTILDKAHVQVIDLTSVKSDDALNHGKFASSGVVQAIGQRLADGQPLTDAKATLRRAHRRGRSGRGRDARQGGDAGGLRARRDHRPEHPRDPGGPGGLARAVDKGRDGLAPFRGQPVNERRGARRRRRRTDGAPKPYPCQLVTRPVHCHFVLFQGIRARTAANSRAVTRAAGESRNAAVIGPLSEGEQT